jgi:hypothetical protein
VKTACDEVRNRLFHENQLCDERIDNFQIPDEDNLIPARLEDDSSLIDLSGFAFGCLLAGISGLGAVA